MTPAARERMQVRVPVLLVSAAAWTLLLLEYRIMAVPILCPGGMETMSPSAPLEMLLGALRSVSLVVDWGLMILAMMAPLVIAPLRHVYYRSLARRRTVTIGLFAAGYAAIWMIAGIMLLPVLLVSKGLTSGSPAFLTMVVVPALVWQFSPAKQICLNRCHSHPPLAVFGISANLDAFWFGLSHGAWCVGSCWPAMLVPAAFSRGHLVTMAALTLWLAAERLEMPVPPSWRWRAPTKALRILYVQTRIIFQRELRSAL